MNVSAWVSRTLGVVFNACAMDQRRPICVELSPASIRAIADRLTPLATARACCVKLASPRSFRTAFPTASSRARFARPWFDGREG